MRSTSLMYPPSPQGVPEALTRPTSAYRRQAYLAVLALGVFLVAYAALTGWFGYTAYRLFAKAAHAHRLPFLPLLAGVAAAFLAVLMVKGIFFVRRGGLDGAVEIPPGEHPRLRAFLSLLAAETGAPTPNRIFLTSGVNAAVFYDLSLLNLFFPAKKNLLIGLGLVNVLTLSELKAVLAHELGHFAQRSMKVGRWVYVTSQIAQHLVARRDAFDTFLRGLSRQDIRIAWIGWAMRLVVWSIRSLIDTLFAWVTLVDRALSREMEFQADLVSVSVTGSDALVHALSRTAAADEELDRAIAFAIGRARQGTPVEDVFALQSWLIDRRREILGDPLYGSVPPLPDDPESAAQHRVFAARIAQPSRMWATHPSNEDREANAKRLYVPARLDERSSWGLFDEPERVRAAATQDLYRRAELLMGRETMSVGDAIEALRGLYARRYFEAGYRGVYLDRSVVRHARSPTELAPALPAADALAESLASLYPESLSGDLERAQELACELALLEGLERGVLQAPGKLVRFRGQEHRRRELPGLVERVRAELVAARAVLSAHDARVRSTHLAAARAFGGDWEAHLRGLIAVLHYADHAWADLDDAAGAFRNVLQVVVADGKVSKGEFARLLRAGQELHDAIARIYAASGDVTLSATLEAQLGTESWRAFVGPLGWPPPTADNFTEWARTLDGWVDGTLGQLRALSTHTLEELLVAEERVRRAVLGEDGDDPLPARAPAAPAAPARYGTLLLGEERPRQLRLDWWDRFMTADGAAATVLRLAVAGGIVGTVLVGGHLLS